MSCWDNYLIWYFRLKGNMAVCAQGSDVFSAIILTNIIGISSKKNVSLCSARLFLNRLSIWPKHFKKKREIVLQMNASFVIYASFVQFNAIFFSIIYYTGTFHCIFLFHHFIDWIGYYHICEIYSRLSYIIQSIHILIFNDFIGFQIDFHGFLWYYNWMDCLKPLFDSSILVWHQFRLQAECDHTYQKL